MKIANFKLGIIAGVLASFTFTACSSSDNDPGADPADAKVTFSAISASNISETSFDASVNVTITGASATASGFCYSQQQNPTTSDPKATASASTGTMSATISSLTSGTQYYVRAYVVVGGQVSYSVQATVTTKAQATTSVTPKEIENYRGPSYPDDYRSIADWAKRSQWNLANVHDPTVMLADDGYYYMYQTDASFGNAHEQGGHFHGRRSKDLVNWEYLGGTMMSSPSWILEKVNEYREKLGLAKLSKLEGQGFWAPCARNIGGGKYRMYYSVVNDGTLIDGDGTWPERSFIGMMETTDPASNVWEDKGFVLCAASDRGTDWSRPANKEWYAYNKWNAIDPSLIITPEGEHWLIYGSWHCGIAAVQLDPATGKTLEELPDPWGTASEIAPYGKLIATRRMNDRWQASEGPEVIYRDGFYYLFLAYDGLDVPYNTRVVRSAKITGPYVGIDGTDVTNFGGDAFPIVTHPYKFGDDHGWVGISHCGVFSDNAGNWYFSSQARFPNGYDDWAPNAIMLGHVRAIKWTSTGWPVVMPERYGAVPNIPVTEAELVGSWQHIDLGYKYAEQKGSTTMTFAENHSITAGPWKGGKWSFDEATQTLTANGVELIVARECDWESPTRKACIVYAGVNNQKTYWGKK
ncbi:MAG: arabinan endo-1,5-alpha-L-arabinosidase [Clostridium sp.]|nr:arabinan endo-1,5-alpha-L-arabinosidase [Clostridium sp.]